MRAYLSVFRMRLRLECQYRGAALGGIVCQIFFGLILIALYRALYAGNPQSMPLETITTYVWLQQAFFRMLLSSDAELADKIRTGNIAYDMCRPLDLYGFYYTRVMALKLMGSLLRAVPMLLFASLLPDGWHLSAPASPLACLLAVSGLVLGLGCVSAMENLVMALTMRTLDPKGIQAMLNLLMMILSGNVLPLTLYPDSWQRVLRFFPYAQMLDAPIRLYTGQYAPGMSGSVLLLQALWTLLLVLSGCMLWQRNQRRLVIQGG